MRCWHEAGFRHHWRRFAPAFTGAPWHARLWGVRNRAAIQNWMPWHALTSSSASRMGSVVSIKVALSLRRSLEAEGSILWLWPSARIGMSRDEEWMWCAWWDMKNTKNTTDLDVFFIHQLLLLLLNPSELNLKSCVFTWDPVILQSGGALQTTFDGLVGMTRRGISSHVSSFGWAQVQTAGSFHQLLDWIVGESQRCDFTTADVVAMELSCNISAYYAQCLSINLLWHVCHQWLPIFGSDHLIWSFLGVTTRPCGQRMTEAPAASLLFASSRGATWMAFRSKANVSGCAGRYCNILSILWYIHPHGRDVWTCLHWSSPKRSTVVKCFSRSCRGQPWSYKRKGLPRPCCRCHCPGRHQIRSHLAHVGHPIVTWLPMEAIFNCYRGLPQKLPLRPVSPPYKTLKWPTVVPWCPMAQVGDGQYSVLSSQSTPRRTPRHFLHRSWVQLRVQSAKKEYWVLHTLQMTEAKDKKYSFVPGWPATFQVTTSHLTPTLNATSRYPRICLRPCLTTAPCGGSPSVRTSEGGAEWKWAWRKSSFKN